LQQQQLDTSEAAVIFIVDHLTQHNASWIGTSFVEWRILNWSLHIPSFASIVVHPSAAAAKTPTQLKLKAAVLLSEHPHHQECALRGGYTKAFVSIPPWSEMQSGRWSHPRNNPST